MLREERHPWGVIMSHFPGRSRAGLLAKYGKIAPRGENRRFIHSSRFTDEERALISRVRAEGMEWKQIQEQHFPNHTWRQLAHGYNRTQSGGEGDVWARRVWSEEDSKKLLILREEQLMDWPTLGRVLGRSHSAVQNKYIRLIEKRAEESGRGKKLGYVNVNSSTHWGKDEEAKIVEMIKNGTTDDDIRECWPERGFHGVRNKIVDLKHKHDLLSPRINPVDGKSVLKIKRLKAQGMLMKEIADVMPEFTFYELRYAYKMALKKKEAKLTQKAARAAAKAAKEAQKATKEAQDEVEEAQEEAKESESEV